MPEKKDFELSPKIEELQEKLSKEPKSRLFLQLAEEYRKSGMPEEAVEVCKEGLKHHPTYIAAKVTLGKAYLDLKKIDDAQHIFEDVIEQSSDNLVANRNLADIYYMKGFTDDSLKHYKIINMYNPNDQLVSDRIKELQEQLAEPEPIGMEEDTAAEGVAEKAEVEEEVPASEEQAEEVVAAEDKEEEIIVEEETQPEELIEESEEEIGQITPIEITTTDEKEELPTEEATKETEGLLMEEVDTSEEEGYDIEEIPAVKIDLPEAEEDEEENIPAVEIDLTAEEKEEITAQPQAEEAPTEQEAVMEEEASLPEEEKIEVAELPADMEEKAKEEVLEEEQFEKPEPEEMRIESKKPSEAKETAAVEGVIVEEKISKKPAEKIEEKKEHALTEKKEMASVTLAELYAKQGLFDKSIEIYKHMLEENPDSAEIKARLNKLIEQKKQIKKAEAQKVLEKAAQQQEEKRKVIQEPPAKIADSQHPGEKKMIMQESEHLPAQEEKKKEKIDTLNKWLDRINKLK
jgi:tetratricopeptide (TPR) repeat protein